MTQRSAEPGRILDVMIGLRCSFAIMMLLTLPCVAEEVPSVNDVVDHVMEVYGGSAEWKAAVDFEQSGRFTSKMRGSEGTIVRSIHYPDALKVEIRYPTKSEVRVWAHGMGLRNGKQVEGIQLVAMMLQAARLSVPKILDDGRDGLIDGGMVEHDGVRYRELTVPLSEEATLTVLVDPATGYVVRSIGRAPAVGFPGGGMAFASDYGDFRTVDGLLFPFRETNYAQGMQTGTTELERITFGKATPSSGKKLPNT